MALAAILAAACSQGERRRQVSARSVARDTVSLDSCVRLDAKGRPQNHLLEPGETIPPPHPGAWTATRRIVLDSFQLTVPAVAVAHSDAAHGAYYISDLPGCRYFCGLEVNFVRDSADRSLADYAASLRVVDTARNPDDEMWRPGPARPIRLARSDGLIMETPCGDCTSGQIVAKRGRTIAHVGYSLDDRDGSQPGIMCRLARVASTFDWIP